MSINYNTNITEYVLYSVVWLERI